MSITPYTDLIVSQHRTQPKYMAWLSAALEKVDSAITVSNSIPSYFDIDTAEGNQLDTLGEIIGRSRVLNFHPAAGLSPVLDDANYRIALKAKIAQNQWDGTIPQIYDIWYGLFTDLGLVVVDNQDMTMSVMVNGQIDPITTELIASGYIIPKPAGVALTIIGVQNVSSPQYVGLTVSTAKTTHVSTNQP